MSLEMMEFLFDRVENIVRKVKMFFYAVMGKGKKCWQPTFSSFSHKVLLVYLNISSCEMHFKCTKIFFNSLPYNPDF